MTDRATLDPLVAAVHAAAAARGATLALAESLTGGLVAAALTGPAGASATFLGGVVVYATTAKAELGVDPDLLARRGPVDADVAVALAVRVRERFAATHGVATTGVAGPDPVGDHPPGSVFVAVASERGSRAVHLTLPPGRALVRQLTVVHALDLLRRELLDLDPHDA